MFIVMGNSTGITNQTAPMDGRVPHDEFESFYRDHLLPAVRLAHVMTGSNALAEDLVHDAFLKLRPRYDTVREPGPYFRAMVVNECRMWARRHEVESRHAGGMDERLELPPEHDDAWAHLLTLPPRRRAVLFLRFYEDLSTNDIAEALGCRPTTVRSLLRRGLASMREVMPDVH